jgi:hypothetical protein
LHRFGAVGDLCLGFTQTSLELATAAISFGQLLLTLFRRLYMELL